MRHVVVMVTTSYPRFPGDAIGTFMEPIAKGIAARGHEVHLVAPWHPRLTRGKTEDGVFLHFFRYAPVPSLNVFGYAEGLRGDVRLRGAAWMAAPFAIAAGWFEAMRVAQKRRATMMHAHWVVPGGVIAAAARPSLPLVVSLHGSDVFVAEHTPAAGVAARRARVAEVRGRGLMWGIELTEPAAAYVAAAREQGLLVATAGANVIRLVPPLVITREELERGVAILDEILA